MIVREHSGSLWLFDQADHSRLCGELAVAWGASPFASAPPFLCEAAATHDSGWTEWDRRPRLDDESGRPHPYSRMPPGDYREIWERGLKRGWERGEQVGLMVSLHAMRFFAHKHEDPDRDLLRRERTRQSEALRRLGYPGSAPDRLPEPYATWHEWMFFWDALSLFLCEGWPSPWEREIPANPSVPAANVAAERRGDGGEEPGGELHLRPLPFRSSLDLVVIARTIPPVRYLGQAELDDAVAGAARRAVRWRLVVE